MAEHAETLTISVESANEFRAAWDAFVAPALHLANEEYWKQVVERGQRLLTAYESIWKVNRGSVLTKVLADAIGAIEDRVRNAERELRYRWFQMNSSGAAEGGAPLIEVLKAPGEQSEEGMTDV